MNKGLKTKLTFTFDIDLSINELDINYDVPLKPNKIFKPNINIKNQKSKNKKLF